MQTTVIPFVEVIQSLKKKMQRAIIVTLSWVRWRIKDQVCLLPFPAELQEHPPT